MANLKIEVKKLPEVPNVCNQSLREVWKSKETSIAYVEMDLGNESLLHHHQSFTEIYYILDGEGIISVGEEDFPVTVDTLIEVKPGQTHKLKNTGESTLRHLVISTPAFSPEDVVLDNED